MSTQRFVARTLTIQDDFQQIGQVAAQAFVDNPVFRMCLPDISDEKLMLKLQWHFSQVYRYMYKAAIIIVLVIDDDKEEAREVETIEAEVVIGGFILPSPNYNPGLWSTFTILVPSIISTFGFGGMKRALPYFSEVSNLKAEATEDCTAEKAKTNLDAVFVHPKYQGQNIGTSMMLGAATVTQNYNVSMTFFTEGSKNERFYKKIGATTMANDIVSDIEVYFMST